MKPIMTLVFVGGLGAGKLQAMGFHTTLPRCGKLMCYVCVVNGPLLRGPVVIKTRLCGLGPKADNILLG